MGQTVVTNYMVKLVAFAFCNRKKRAQAPEISPFSVTLPSVVCPDSILVPVIIIVIIIINLIQRYSLTRVKLTALYKHLITKTTLTYISANKTLIIVA